VCGKVLSTDIYIYIYIFIYIYLYKATYKSRILSSRRSTLVCRGSVLQCVAMCRNVLQCVAVRCSALQCVAVCCRVLRCVAVCCSAIVNVTCNTKTYGQGAHAHIHALTHTHTHTCIQEVPEQRRSSLKIDCFGDPVKRRTSQVLLFKK